jgi:hypothetical protein
MLNSPLQEATAEELPILERIRASFAASPARSLANQPRFHTTCPSAHRESIQDSRIESSFERPIELFYKVLKTLDSFLMSLRTSGQFFNVHREFRKVRFDTGQNLKPVWDFWEPSDLWQSDISFGMKFIRSEYCWIHLNNHFYLCHHEMSLIYKRFVMPRKGNMSYHMSPRSQVTFCRSLEILRRPSKSQPLNPKNEFSPFCWSVTVFFRSYPKMTELKETIHVRLLSKLRQCRELFLNPNWARHSIAQYSHSIMV